MTTSWLDELNARPVLDIAIALAYRADGGQIGPCPACKATQRSKSDKRPPVGINTAGNGWQCHACSITGASTTFAALHFMGAVLPKGSPLWGTLRDHVVSAGLIANASAPAPAPAAPPKRPPQAEVLDVWARCQRVDTLDSGDAAAEFLAFRHYGPPSQLAALDLVRVMPIGMPTPWWWPTKWSHTWRLMMMAYEADGAPTALHARAVADTSDGKTHWLLCERDKERLFEVRRLLFANPIGLKMLRGEVPDELVVVVGEGLTGTVNSSLILGDKVAVFGATSGGFKALADVKAWPKKCTVYVVTDDTDKQGTGEKYAREVLDSVPSHCAVKRVRWNASTAGENDGKRDSGNATKEEYIAAIKAAVDMRAPSYGGQQQDSNRQTPPPADAAEALAQLSKIVQEVLIAQSEDDQRKILAGVIASALPEALRAAYANAKAEIEGQFVMLHGAKRLKKEIDRLLTGIRGRSTTPLKGGGPRGNIEITNSMPQMVEQALEVIGAHPNVYQRAGDLVCIRSDRLLGRSIGRVPAALARLMLAEGAAWVKWVKRGDELREVEDLPPEWLAKTVVVLPSYPLRDLEAIVCAPFMREDGTIATARGYDPASRIYLDLADGLDIVVQDEPTAEEVSIAVDTLLDVFSDFPLEHESHRSGVLAAILTLLARPAIAGCCPLFMITASASRSGKTLLADLIGAIALGGNPPHQPYDDDPKEQRKLISSVLLAAVHVMLVDNVDSTFGGGPIDALLTSTEWHDRRLAVNELIRVPARTVWFVTATNPILAGDIVSRTVHMRIVPNVERPETRGGFKYDDVHSYVIEHRAELIRAALTILRGYVVAGRPKKSTPLGGFESWSRLVRDAVIWAGQPDPLAGMETLRRDSDPRSNEAAALVHAWHLAFNNMNMSLAEVADAMKNYRANRGTANANAEHAPLYAALRQKPELWDRDNELLTVKFSGSLRKMRDKVLGSRKLVSKHDKDQNISLWSVVAVEAAS